MVLTPCYIEWIMKTYKYIGESCSAIKNGDIIKAEPYTMSYFMGEGEKRQEVTQIDIYSMFGHSSIGVSIKLFEEVNSI